MTQLFNHPYHKKLRQQLRNQTTRPEQLLWLKLKGKQCFGLKFRRQCGIGQYIVDFYCPQKKLVVEIDGDTHYIGNATNYDETRDNYLKSLGLKVLRFTNLDIQQNIQGVLEMIAREVGKLT